MAGNMTTVLPAGDGPVKLLSEGSSAIFEKCPSLSRHLLLERNSRLQDLVLSDRFQGSLSHSLVKELAKTQALLNDDLSCKSCGTILSDGKTSKWITSERGTQPSPTRARKNLKKNDELVQEQYTRLECPVCSAYVKRPLDTNLSTIVVDRMKSQIIKSSPPVSIDTPSQHASPTLGTTGVSKAQIVPLAPVGKVTLSKNRKQALKKNSLQAMLAKSEKPKAGLGDFNLASFMKKS